MTEETKPAKQEQQELEQVDQTEATYMPTVDIYDEGDTIYLTADMPGTDGSSVDVCVENGVLKVEGKGTAEAPEGCELIRQEYAVGKFRRDFTLSDQIDVDGIKAKVTNGVLKVTLNKREEVKTKKIKISN